MRVAPITDPVTVSGAGGYPMKITLRTILKWLDGKRRGDRLAHIGTQRAFVEDLTRVAKAAHKRPTWDKGD